MPRAPPRTSKSPHSVKTDGNFHVIEHILIDHKLVHLRQPQTHIKEFNRLLKEIAMLMSYELTKDFPAREITITSGTTEIQGRVIAGKKAVLVPILRAGLIMAEGIKEVTASSRMGHIGLHKHGDEIIEYMVQLPKPEGRNFVLIDPILATGRTACRAIEIIKENGTDLKKIMFMSLIASQKGMERVRDEYPEVAFYVAAVDPEVDEEGRVKPGLGHIGQRLFGTP
jgi:uracil phosphoribosyltransferase